MNCSESRHMTREEFFGIDEDACKKMVEVASAMGTLCFFRMDHTERHCVIQVCNPPVRCAPRDLSLETTPR